MTRPCYLGATYLGCGWSWIHECQEWSLLGFDRCAWFIVHKPERWPHPCQGWEVLPTATYGGRATLGLCWAP